MLCVERVARIGESVILYDASLANHIEEAWFDPASWPGAPRVQGRGVTLFIRCAGEDWVLRHYHRGGQAARISSDAFAWTGEARTRCFREWRLLAQLRAAGLPVPCPVAARYLRRGLLYRADLITRRIPDVMPLSAVLAAGPLPQALWRGVGACIGRFHAAGVFHADLNAHNVQVNDRGEVFLLVFDRGRIMARSGAWRRRNLARLHRSLVKVAATAARGFGAAEWSALLAGYAAAEAGGGSPSPPSV
jgi:3-deoxy-D-manno-octulosonic acid kinase